MIKTLLNNKDIVEEYKDDMYRNWVQENKKQSDIYLCVRDIFESSRKELYVAFINSSKHIFINLEYWISWLSIREVYDIDSPSYNHRWTKDELNSLYIGEYEFIIDLHNLKIAQKKILDYKIDNAVAEKILE